MKFATFTRISVPMLSVAALALLSGCGNDYQKPAYVDPNSQGQVAGTASNRRTSTQPRCRPRSPSSTSRHRSGQGSSADHHHSGGE